MCCDALNLFAGRAPAGQWQLTHPEVRGEIVSQACATMIGRQTFGPLLQDCGPTAASASVTPGLERESLPPRPTR
ncbi:MULTISPECIES: hypothetical protein [unclassified Streptomyces]|uniref:hypothetical protein n=1 Tax=unclassified Streptomyces TaxID=2593676 RepID=UPI0028837EA7|nr:hypothetical protein [Streptomyces sp. DSM 41633]